MLRSALGVLRRPLRTRALSTLPPDLPLGTLLVWGKPDDGRLGMKVEQSFGAKDVLLGPIVPPTVNPHIHDVVEVVCSAMKTMALTKDGSVYSWGGCQNLSLGHGDDVRNVLRPKKLEALSGIRIVHISGGETASAAVSADGDIYTWGWGGGWGQGERLYAATPLRLRPLLCADGPGSGGLGHGDRTTQPRPALIQSLEAAGTKMVQVRLRLAASVKRAARSQRTLPRGAAGGSRQWTHAWPDCDWAGHVVGQGRVRPVRQRPGRAGHA